MLYRIRFIRVEPKAKFINIPKIIITAVKKAMRCKPRQRSPLFLELFKGQQCARRS